MKENQICRTDVFALFAASAVSFVILGFPGNASGADVSKTRMVWAHYTPWITPDNVSLEIGKFYGYPQYERGSDPYGDEIRRAINCGVQGFFCDIVGHRDGSESSYWDLRPFLKGAEGTPFQVGICLDVKTSAEIQVRELVRMLKTYGDHPNYPKWEGRYVVCFYTYLGWESEEIQSIRAGCEKAGFPLYVIANVDVAFRNLEMEDLIPRLDDFDMYFAFGMRGSGAKTREEEIAEMSAFAGRHGKRYMATVYPGYYGAWLNGRNPFFQPYCCMDTAMGHFETAMKGENADWLHVTTWNDHDETTQQPKRLAWGNGPLLRAMSRAFLRQSPDERDDVVFSYLREVTPGTLLRVEAMRLPSVQKGVLTASAVLYGSDGQELARLEDRQLSVGWDRVEWAVPTTGISTSPYFLPCVRVTGKDYERNVFLPPIFLAAPCLRNPESVKVALSNRSRIKSRLDVSYADSVLKANCSIMGAESIRRAVLFCNDRPVAQFLNEEKPLLPLFLQGKWDISVAVGAGARILSAVKSNNENGTPNFSWDARRMVSHKVPAWSRHALLLAMGPEEEVTVANGKTVESFRPADFLASNKRQVGTVTVRRTADCTIYNAPQADFSKGTAFLSVYSEKPEPTDAYWVEFEFSDGTYAESRVVYPFAAESVPVRMNVVETPVTIEHRSGASGIYVRGGEFLTDASRLPVKRTRVVETQVSPLALRETRYRIDQVTGKMPLALRQWPMDAFELSFEFTVRENDKDVPLLSRGGWQEGPEAILRADGFLVASYCTGEHGRQSVSSKRRLAPGEKVRARMVSDCRTLKLFVGEELQGVRTLESPVRVYGNCAPAAQGVDALSFRPFFGTSQPQGGKE